MYQCLADGRSLLAAIQRRGNLCRYYTRKIQKNHERKSKEYIVVKEKYVIAVNALAAAQAAIKNPRKVLRERRKNVQTKSRQCRGKEEESDTACCIGTPEHCGLVRRDLVVCPPFWLLPRIETGDSFLWACCAPLLRPHPQENVPAWALRGEPFGGYGGGPFRSP